MSGKVDAKDTGGFEFVLTKSPMAGKTEEKKVEQKVEVKAQRPQEATAKPVENPAKQRVPPVVPTVAPPAVQPGFEHIANIPTIFCASREVAKGLLVDLFAMIGTLNAMETGKANFETLPMVLQNSQMILTNLSDVMIRDCHVTDDDLNDVLNVFKEVNAQEVQQVTTQPQQGEQKAVVEQMKEQKPEQKKAIPGGNIL